MAAAIPLVRASVLQHVAAGLDRCGVPVERVLESVRLSPQALQQPDAFVPFTAVTLCLETAARREGIEDVGLRIGQQLSGRLPGTLGRLVARAGTLREAADTFHRLTPHHNSGVRAGLTLERGEALLHHVFLHGDEREWGQFAAAVLMQYLKLIEAALGPGWRPSAIQVPMRSLPGVRSVPLLADTPLEFGQAALTITFPALLLDRPFRNVQPGRTASAVDVWNLTKPADDVGGAVQQVVAAMLPSGYPDVAVVAEMVRMSPRTLQRRLQAEGLTFGGVVARTRCDVARRLLVDPTRKVIDVAYDLGYSDPAHFTRAFSRWTGQAPRAFRRQAFERTGDRVPSSEASV